MCYNIVGFEHTGTLKLQSWDDSEQYTTARDVYIQEGNSKPYLFKDYYKVRHKCLKCISTDPIVLKVTRTLSLDDMPFCLQIEGAAIPVDEMLGRLLYDTVYKEHKEAITIRGYVPVETTLCVLRDIGNQKSISDPMQILLLYHAIGDRKELELLLQAVSCNAKIRVYFIKNKFQFFIDDIPASMGVEPETRTLSWYRISQDMVTDLYWLRQDPEEKVWSYIQNMQLDVDETASLMTALSILSYDQMFTEDVTIEAPAGTTMIVTRKDYGRMELPILSKRTYKLKLHDSIEFYKDGRIINITIQDWSASGMSNCYIAVAGDFKAVDTNISLTARYAQKGKKK